MRRIPLESWLIGVAFLLILAMNLSAALAPADSLMSWFSSDDAFYYFKTAQNISEGRGITFDGLGRDSGFHPLWMAICVPIFALARYDRILPLRLVIAVSGLLSASTALLLYRLARRGISVWAAGLVALYFAFSAYIHPRLVELGLESSLSAFFLVLLYNRVAAQAGQPDPQDAAGWRAAAPGLLLSGLAGALAILARLDNVFLVLAAGAWLVVRPLRARILLSLDLALVLLGVFWSYFTRVGFGPAAAELAPSAYWMAALAVGVRAGLGYLLWLYEAPPTSGSGIPAYLARLLAACALGSLILAGVLTILSMLNLFPGFPRLVLLYEGGFALAALLLTRGLAWLFFPAQAGEESLRIRPVLARGALFAAPIGLLLALYMTLSLGYFGTPMPVSGQIKRWWGTLPNPVYGRPAGSLGGLFGLNEPSRPWGLLDDVMKQPAQIPAPLRQGGYALLGAGLFWIQRKRVLRALHQTALLALLSGGFLLLISYTGTGYIHMRPWYWTAQMIALTLLLGLWLDAAMETIGAWLGKLSPRSMRPSSLQALLSGLAGLLIIATGWSNVARRIPQQVSAEQTGSYLRQVHELETITPPGAVVGMTGGGVMAYFIEGRVIVNLDGLMNTVEYFRRLQSGDAGLYLDKIGLEYVFSVQEVLDSDPYFQYKDRMVPLHNYNGTTLFLWK